MRAKVATVLVVLVAVASAGLYATVVLRLCEKSGVSLVPHLPQRLVQQVVERVTAPRTFQVQVAGTSAAPAPAPAVDRTAVARAGLAMVQNLGAEACSCEDAACAHAVEQRFGARLSGLELDPRDSAAYSEAFAEAAGCLARLLENEGAPDKLD